jgi:hypothetical protein
MGDMKRSIRLARTNWQSGGRFDIESEVEPCDPVASLSIVRIRSK